MPYLLRFLDLITQAVGWLALCAVAGIVVVEASGRGIYVGSGRTEVIVDSKDPPGASYYTAIYCDYLTPNGIEIKFLSSPPGGDCAWLAGAGLVKSRIVP
jgi:hypothetical protein